MFRFANLFKVSWNIQSIKRLVCDCRINIHLRIISISAICIIFKFQVILCNLIKELFHIDIYWKKITYLFYFTHWFMSNPMSFFQYISMKNFKDIRHFLNEYWKRGFVLTFNLRGYVNLVRKKNKTKDLLWEFFLRYQNLF